MPAALPAALRSAVRHCARARARGVEQVTTCVARWLVAPALLLL